MDNIKRIKNKIWKKHSRSKHLRGATRNKWKQEAKAFEKDCEETSRVLLQPWMTILDESIHFLVQLYNLPIKDGDDRPIAMTTNTLIAKACGLALSGRKLIILGFEDGAAIIVRSLFETLDLATVSMHDDKFALGYFGEDSDEKTFWTKNVAYGKINQTLKAIAATLDLPQDDIDDFVQFCRNSKDNLSGSVHVSPSSAMLSCLVPSLANPGFFVRTIHGHHGVNSPALTKIMYTRIFYFGSTFMKLLLNRHDSAYFRSTSDISSKPFKDLIASYMTFQEVNDTLDECELPEMERYLTDGDQSEGMAEKERGRGVKRGRGVRP